MSNIKQDQNVGQNQIQGQPQQIGEIESLIIQQLSTRISQLEIDLAIARAELTVLKKEQK